MTTTTTRYTLLGIDDEVTTCELCGRVDLRCTVVLSQRDADHQEVAQVRFGRDCASKAMYGESRNKRKAAVEMEREARAFELRVIEVELRAKKILHVYAPDPERTDVMVIRVPKGLAYAGQRWGRRWPLDDGRTFLRFDFVVTSPESAARLVPGRWSMLGESLFVGTAS